jgi:hypothetical protein
MVGLQDGFEVGELDGRIVGSDEGPSVGTLVGLVVGWKDGRDIEGREVGCEDG